MNDSDEKGVATFGAGCFWCVEAVFLELDGVESVESGYMGGSLKNPTYEQVCSGRTGHAEVIQIHFDPARVRFGKLLEVFWGTHDPTTLNRQGFDSGSQYRSVVFYHNEEQKELAESLRKKFDESGAFSSPVVTEISRATTFWPAEDYHQNYFANNGGQPYCRANIIPKLEKFRKVFADDLKSGATK